jgi:DNA-binding CsgD family transcriptional regulator
LRGAARIEETGQVAVAGDVRFARRELDCLGHAGLDSFAYRQQAARKLHQVVPYDAVWWWTTDPATSFFTSGMFEPHPNVACRAVHVNEFVEPDHNKFRVLARRQAHVALLSDATDADLKRSRRYRNVLRPEGLEHELRLALVSESTCWGALALLRATDAPDFSTAEARKAAQLTEVLAEGLRIGLVMGAIATESPSEGPGLIALDDDDRVLAITPSAEHWCRELGQKPPALPEAVMSIAACVRHIDDGADGEPLTLRARMRTGSGRWLVAHGSRVQQGTAMAGSTAVIIEEAKPAEVAPLIVRAYGLSEREAELTRLVLHGLSTKEIAAEMLLSPYTVQDYLKSVFEKVDVRSRRELVARIFDQYYWPRYGHGDRTPDWHGSPAGLRDSP